jgi:hypothetical protein
VRPPSPELELELESSLLNIQPALAVRGGANSRPKGPAEVAKELAAARALMDDAAWQRRQQAVETAALAAQLVAAKLGADPADISERLGDFEHYPTPPSGAALYIEEHREAEQASDRRASEMMVSQILHARYNGTPRQLQDMYEQRASSIAGVLAQAYAAGREELKKLLPERYATSVQIPVPHIAAPTGPAPGMAHPTLFPTMYAAAPAAAAVQMQSSAAAADIREVVTAEAKANPTAVKPSASYAEFRAAESSKKKKAKAVADARATTEKAGRMAKLVSARPMPVAVVQESFVDCLAALSQSLEGDSKALSNFFVPIC